MSWFERIAAEAAHVESSGGTVPQDVVNKLIHRMFVLQTSLLNMIIYEDMNILVLRNVVADETACSVQIFLRPLLYESLQMPREKSLAGLVYRKKG